MLQLRADQERVRTLIKETITLLCKNGLSFDAHFSIEALIGVTLDDKDVFLVNINELVRSEKALAAAAAEAVARDDQSDEVSETGDHQSGDDSGNTRKRSLMSPSQRRKRRKKLIKSEQPQNEDSCSDDNVADYSNDDSNSGRITGRTRPVDNIKRETPGDSENEENNVIIIKEELEDSWQDGGGAQDDSSFGQFTNLAGTSQDQNFASLADMSLMPVSSQDASQVWSQSAAYVSPGGGGRPIQRAPNISASQPQLDPSQEADIEEDDPDNPMHHPSHLPPTGKKQQPRRRCRRCYRSGIRRESMYFCASCPEQPALCIVPCFTDHHTAKDIRTPAILSQSASGGSYVPTPSILSQSADDEGHQQIDVQPTAMAPVKDMSVFPQEAADMSPFVHRLTGENVMPQPVDMSPFVQRLTGEKIFLPQPVDRSPFVQRLTGKNVMPQMPNRSVGNNVVPRFTQPQGEQHIQTFTYPAVDNRQSIQHALQYNVEAQTSPQNANETQ